MLLAENHLNETVKLVGEELKADIQKLVLPLAELFSKIPKITQIHTNFPALIIKENKVNHNKMKTSAKTKKN